MWKQVTSTHWVRSDGATVIWDQRFPHPNPMNPNSRMWTAWEPDPSQHCLYMERGRIRNGRDSGLWKPGFPRRWKTPETAMQAVDREFPLGLELESD